MPQMFFSDWFILGLFFSTSFFFNLIYLYFSYHMLNKMIGKEKTNNNFLWWK